MYTMHETSDQVKFPLLMWRTIIGMEIVFVYIGVSLGAKNREEFSIVFFFWEHDPFKRVKKWRQINN